MKNKFCPYIYECDYKTKKRDCFNDSECNIKHFYEKWGTDYIRQRGVTETEGVLEKSNQSNTLRPADSNLEEMFIGSML